jgi:hypothetical protein
MDISVKVLVVAVMGFEITRSFPNALLNTPIDLAPPPGTGVVR